MFKTMRPLHLTMRAHFCALRSWFPIFYVWSAQWMMNSAVKWYGEWKLPAQFQSGTALLAALISIGILLFSGLKAESDDRQNPARALAIWVIVPFGVAAGSLFLLEDVHAIDPFFMDLFRSLLLAFFFSCLGVILGLELVLLGIWLFCVALVTSTWYLGFAPMVLECMGGFSLAACGLILSRWTRPFTSRQPA